MQARSALRCALAVVSAAVLAIVLMSAARANEAAVVVRHGDGSMTYALVIFPEDEISSFDLLRRSTISLSTVSFGALGEAVCTLDGEGCALADCRQRLCQTGAPDSPFWQFFRRGANGDWESQPLGAGASRVTDGDIDVWSWTGGEANVPGLDLTGVAAKLGVTLDGAENGVYVGSFDATGNPTTIDGSGSARSTELVAGVAALGVLATVGIILVRRNRATRRGTTA